jgi:hypothetical protein
MREWTRQCRLEEAFRQELFRLINQYVSSPRDATVGKIARTLVNFQQIRAAGEERCQCTCEAILSEASAGQVYASCASTKTSPLFKTTTCMGRLTSHNSQVGTRSGLGSRSKRLA